MNNSDVGVRGRIKAYLQEKNISQNKFAKAIGVSPAFVNNISKGIGADKLQRISNIFTDLNTDWLLTGKGNMLKGQSVSTNSEDTNQQQNDMTIQELLEAIKRRDQQMDEMLSQQGRLISIIENMSGTTIKQSHVGYAIAKENYK